LVLTDPTDRLAVNNAGNTDFDEKSTFRYHDFFLAEDFNAEVVDRSLISCSAMKPCPSFLRLHCELTSGSEEPDAGA
jgi:hypothetical protein